MLATLPCWKGMGHASPSSGKLSAGQCPSAKYGEDLKGRGCFTHSAPPETQAFSKCCASGHHLPGPVAGVGQILPHEHLLQSAGAMGSGEGAGECPRNHHGPTGCRGCLEEKPGCCGTLSWPMHYRHWVLLLTLQQEYFKVILFHKPSSTIPCSTNLLQLFLFAGPGGQEGGVSLLRSAPYPALKSSPRSLEWWLRRSGVNRPCSLWASAGQSSMVSLCS